MSSSASHSIIETGSGLYSFPDAARYIGAKPSELRRWLHGYEHTGRDGIKTFLPPLWQSQIRSPDVDGLGFRDLLELRFVHTFRDAGVPLTLIRATLEAAREELKSAYPFTDETFRTDGRRIFAREVQASGDVHLIDLARKQHVIEKVVGPSLRAGIEFDFHGGAARWFPVRNSKSIVFDPKRKFGQPILSDYDVPTIAIASAVTAEGGDQALVSRIYRVSRVAVRHAVAFEARRGGI